MELGSTLPLSGCHACLALVGCCRHICMFVQGYPILFVHEDGLLLTRFQFTSIFHRVIHAIGGPDECFAPHSFCIGAASSAAAVGWVLTNIQAIGRWWSGAFKDNIIPLVIHSWGKAWPALQGGRAKQPGNPFKLLSSFHNAGPQTWNMWIVCHSLVF